MGRRAGGGAPGSRAARGPGLDHHEFADHLEGLGDAYRLVLVDQRSQGRSDPTPETTWTLERMMQDVIMLARAMGLDRHAVLGHPYGGFVALQNADDHPGQVAAAIVSCGLPSMRYMDDLQENLRAFQPAWLRRQVMDDPLDTRIEDHMERAEGTYAHGGPPPSRSRVLRRHRGRRSAR